MEVKSEREVAQSCPTPSHPMDCGLPGSPIHGIFQARVLEWGATALSGPGPLVIPISVAIKLFTLPTALNIYISFNEIEVKQKINLYITYILKTSSDRKSFEDEMLLTLLILFK